MHSYIRVYILPQQPEAALAMPAHNSRALRGMLADACTPQRNSACVHVVASSYICICMHIQNTALLFPSVSKKTIPNQSLYMLPLGFAATKAALRAQINIRIRIRQSVFTRAREREHEREYIIENLSILAQKKLKLSVVAQKN